MSMFDTWLLERRLIGIFENSKTGKTNRRKNSLKFF